MDEKMTAADRIASGEVFLHAHSLVMKWGVAGAIELASHERSNEIFDSDACDYWTAVIRDLKSRK